VSISTRNINTAIYAPTLFRQYAEIKDLRPVAASTKQFSSYELIYDEMMIVVRAQVGCFIVRSHGDDYFPV
jgi:hypothetical protein